MSVKFDAFARRKNRTRNKIKLNNKSGRPRIMVFRSNKNFYAQLIDDKSGNVITSYSSLVAGDKINKEYKGSDVAELVGKEFAILCIKNNAESVVFDKGAYLYNGRVKSFADSCRNSGLKF